MKTKNDVSTIKSLLNEIRFVEDFEINEELGRVIINVNSLYNNYILVGGASIEYVISKIIEGEWVIIIKS